MLWRRWKPSASRRQEAADKATIQERLAAYADHFWLLFDGDKLVSFVDGMVSATPVLTDEMYEEPTLHDPKGEWQMIFGVNTIPDYRKRGCAGLVLERVIADAKAPGAEGAGIDLQGQAGALLCQVWL